MFKKFLISSLIYFSILLSILYVSSILYSTKNFHKVKISDKFDYDIKIDNYYYKKNYFAFKHKNKYHIKKIEFDNFVFDVLLIIFILTLVWFYFIHKWIKNLEEEKCIFRKTNIEAFATQNSMSILTENIHHELNSPLKVIEKNYNVIREFLAYCLSKTNFNEEMDYKSFINKIKAIQYKFLIKNKIITSKELIEIFDLFDTSLEQIKSVLNNMSSFKQLRYSNGNKSIYDLAEGSSKIMKVIIDHPFTINIDDDLKKYKINHKSGLKNADLLNILLNHLKNSIEANATKIDIFIENIKNDYLLLNIKDNGNGIPKDLIPQLFKPNKSTKDNTGLRGNGLFLNQKVLQIYNGNIQLKKTKEGEGTEFVIKIPIENF